MKRVHNVFALFLAASSTAVACGSDSNGGSLGDSGIIDGNAGTGGSGGNGGSNTGGTATGGANTGGSNTGGSNTGGSNTGGSNPGDANTGGTATGGANTGGSNPGDANTGGSNPGDANTGGDSGVSTGGTPGDGGIPDASTGGTGATDAGDGAVATGCAALADCCATLSGPFQTSCNTQASSGSDVNCNVLLPFFCNSVDGGGGSTVDAGTACNDLSACCATLSAGQQPNCNQIADLGIASTCSTLLSAYQSAALCN
jgi:hypothetical protein